jgi:hypothetical protein
MGNVAYLSFQETLSSNKKRELNQKTDKGKRNVCFVVDVIMTSYLNSKYLNFLG